MMITKKKKNDTKMKAKEKEKINNYIIFMFYKMIITDDANERYLVIHCTSHIVKFKSFFVIFYYKLE